MWCPVENRVSVNHTRLFSGWAIIGVKVWVTGVVCLMTTNMSLGSQQDLRPNILFIYTDDQSHRTVSCYPESHDWVRTPNIDRLALEGVRFHRAYIGAWCMPSRATMLTGLHQHGIESMRMEGVYPGSTYDPSKCPFWPHVFRQNGYFTAHIGKWHTGTDAGFGRDWDAQIVWNRPRFIENAIHYYDHQMTTFNGGEPQLVEGYTTDNYTDWAVNFINGDGRDAKRPWCLWLCYGAVHGPFTPADRHQHAYAGVDIEVPQDVYPPRPGKPQYVDSMEFWTPGKNGEPVERKVREQAPVAMKDMPGRPLKEWVRQYQQGVLAIDEGVGRLMEALQRTGQDDNTFVVFTSDQGFAWGQHGFKTKVAPYDATVAAPLIIRPTEKDRKNVAGRVVLDPVSGVDLPPTFFTQADISLPWEMHGEDLSRLVSEPGAHRQSGALLVHTGKVFGSATHQIPDSDDAALYHGPGIPWYYMYAHKRHKYIRTLIEGEPEELYDLESDPHELVNLALQPSYSEMLQKFRVAATAELRRTGAGFLQTVPVSAQEQKEKAQLKSSVRWKKHVIQPATTGGINSAVANDWNRDGYIDVMSSFGGRVVLFEGPHWKPHTIYAFGVGKSRSKPRPACIHSCLMDVDSDGDMDFVGSNNTVFWLECPNDALSGTPWEYRTVDDEILGTHCLITGDVNGDGQRDLIANSFRDQTATPFPNSIVWLEVPDSPQTARSWIRHVFAHGDAPGGSHYMGIGDVNDDGRPDIACAAKGTDGFENGQWFAWWEQPKNGKDRWRKHTLSTDEKGASNILPADFNSDGHMDYFATRGHGKGVILFQGPHFDPVSVDPDIEFPHSLAVGDIDQDGAIDAITCGKEANGVAAWYHNDGSGHFKKKVIGRNQGSYDTRLKDLDGDGDLDVLIAGHASNNIVWFENPLQ